MENLSMEEQLMDPEEREQVDFMWHIIPLQDRINMQRKDILLVLDLMDDYLEEAGLMHVDDNGEVTYLDGDVDETEQLHYVLHALHEEGSSLTSEQVQIILDAELQYGIQKGWYEE